MGIVPMSPISDLRTGTTNPKFSHDLSFRRQVFVSPADEKTTPSYSNSSMDLTPVILSRELEQTQHIEEAFANPQPPKVGDKRQHPPSKITTSSNLSDHLNSDKEMENETDQESESFAASESEDSTKYPPLSLDKITSVPNKKN
ncbi:hypothetical protein KQX54_014163 [Cotesia glomerata]|uniref:Uncharacterized protein n=1 Tax=Cotesia glomerata TaxID=32391 RepID=A0AAV7I906_COTGL|nr:hypothetical protein KQX54_014163 [Cotesia glomerata]